jgi:hypothetical protein
MKNVLRGQMQVFENVVDSLLQEALKETQVTGQNYLAFSQKISINSITIIIVVS